jgi:uracil-DNA glycosylase
MQSNYFKSWANIIPKKELQDIVKLLDKLYAEHSILPSKELVFEAFKQCNYRNLNVVILGEDPYPQKGVATGIAFANKPNTKLSPSLLQIKNALELDIFDSSLINWCNQGVLMLNTALTVEENKSGSHILLWRPFIKQFLLNLQEYNPGLIYVLLGSNAQSFEMFINSKFNHIIKEKHPAYYSRNKTTMSSYVFEEVNRILYNNNGYKINW